MSETGYACDPGENIDLDFMDVSETDSEPQVIIFSDLAHESQ